MNEDQAVSRKSSGREPKCTRCRNHGVISDLRGHKHKCYWRDCNCTKCLISSDKQRATADRIALFRQQVREAMETDDKSSNVSQDDEIYSEQILRRNSDSSPSKYYRPFDYFPTSNPQPEFKPTKLSPTSIPPSLIDVQSDDIYTKNIDILKYIFPFYDTKVLKIISRGCHDDMLQTVLSLSSYVLENRKRYSSPDYRVESQLQHSSSPSVRGSRCCSSPYCPVNSYLALRNKGTIQESSYQSTQKRYVVINDDAIASPFKKYHYCSEGNDEKRSPYCQACEKFGFAGDKFCPSCGVLY